MSEMMNRAYPDGPMKECGAVAPMTITERLERKRKRLEQELAAVVKAQNLLRQNPETGETFDAICLAL